jgi:hypothetical protein
MALAKHYEETIERMLTNDAREVFQYQHPQSCRSPQKADRPIRQFPTKDEWMRAWKRILQVFQKNEPKYQRRLAQETTFVFKFDAAQMLLFDGKYLSKGEAAKLTGVPWGHILDLEDMFGGVLLRGSHLFIAEQRVTEAQRKYGSDLTLSALIDDIIKERMQA